MLRAILHSFESTVEKIFICTKLKEDLQWDFFHFVLGCFGDV